MIFEIQDGAWKPENQSSRKDHEGCPGPKGTWNFFFFFLLFVRRLKQSLFLTTEEKHHDWIRTATHKRGRGCENARKAKTRFVPLLHHCHHEALANVFVSLISRRAQGCWSEIRNSEYPTCVTSFRPGYLERADRIPACFVDCLCLFALYVPLIQ